ncbi:hypothetical protein MNBD_BACTEROID01-411 [hydrothermal vent metagenome]|uniref:Apiosidase-like catalytic domain-containing protein n=1 Tax=hydrothermal vent metagenome TaxID=652676 RepID=A0A3B0T7A5_9ZZZZ
MNYSLFYLTIFVLLIPYQSEKDDNPALIRFDNIWSSPYQVSTKYRHQLVNENGQYLYILNKTAWAYFVCEYPEKVIENVKKHGANVIRVCLEGAPYYNKLGYDLWPWQGSRKEPDYNNFNEAYWDEVEKRIRYAGENGIGIDLVLYFDLRPSIADIVVQRKYLDMIIHRLSKYSNILAWEIMNEEISNEAFQDSASAYLKVKDPFGHIIISSDGTTDDALWPYKNWMDMAIVHTCTGNQGKYDLEHWYLNIAKNIRQYCKPAFNNESGREIRHKNDDPVHRRKQAWLFSNSGCFWTWHSWDGCEGINDTSYFANGWEYLKPMRTYNESIPFWSLKPNYTVCTTRDKDLVFATLSSPNRKLTVMYCCTRKTSQYLQHRMAYIRIKDGIYQINFINPSNLARIGEMELKSDGLRNKYKILLPDFQDDLLIEIKEIMGKDKTLIDGTL